MPPTILVIESDARLREAVCLHLSLEGYRCDAYAGLNRVPCQAAKDGFTLAVISLDSRAPGFRALLDQAAGRTVPKLAVAPHGERDAALMALEDWADDYVTTPFDMRELIARVHALIRRKRMLDEYSEIAGAGGGGRIAHDGFVLDPLQRRVQIDGRSLKLTEREFRFLQSLAARPGIVFPRELLMETFGHPLRGVSRSIDALVMGIRRQLRPGSHGWDIVTVRGVGYQFRRQIE